MEFCWNSIAAGVVLASHFMVYIFGFYIARHMLSAFVTFCYESRSAVYGSASQ